MGPNHGRFVGKPLLIGAMLVAVALGVVWRYSRLVSHTPIRDLQQVSLGSNVRIAGVVTFIDVRGGRVWIQDETGALPLPLAPDSVHEGEIITVSAVKTHPYDPVLGPVSVELQHIVRVRGMPRISLPPPAAITASDFPGADRNGIQVQVSGVVRLARRDSLGRGELILANSQNEVTVTAPRFDPGLSKLINAEVRVTGIPEYNPHPLPGQPDRRLWVGSLQRVQLDRQAPQPHLYTVRSAYLDDLVKSGHLMRIRGRVLSTTSDSVVIEDGIGSMDAFVDSPPQLPDGTTVELTGYPSREGLRIYLTHATAQPIPASEVPAEPIDLPTLTSVHAIRTLAASEAARAYPIHIRAVATYHDPIGASCLQDETGGIYVKMAGDVDATAGSLVDVIGLSSPRQLRPRDRGACHSRPRKSFAAPHAHRNA